MVIGEIRCRTCSQRLKLTAVDFLSAYRDPPRVRCERCASTTSLPFIATVLVRFAAMVAGYTAGSEVFDAMEDALGPPLGQVPYFLVVFGAVGLGAVTELSLSALLYRRR